MRIATVSLVVIGPFLILFWLTGVLGGIANIIVLVYGLELIRRKDIQAIKILLIAVLAIYSLSLLYVLLQ